MAELLLEGFNHLTSNIVLLVVFLKVVSLLRTDAISHDTELRSKVLA